MEIIDLAKELERLKATSHDVVMPSQLIQAVEDAGTLKIDLKNHGKWPLNHWGSLQLAEKAGIPAQYYHKMLDNGLVDLTAQNVNQWFKKQQDNRLVRIADGKVRAILSDRYRQLDNYDVAIRAMESAQKYGARVDRCELTETRMYVRFLLPGQTQELKPGDDGIPGLQISNSEVGAGAFRVEPFLFRVVCANGLIAPDSLYKIHIGGRLEVGELVYRDDTRRIMDQSVYHQVRDIIDSTFSNQETLRKLVEQLRGAAKITIQDPREVVDATAKDLDLSEEKKLDLLRYFAKEGDTVFGLVNGITRLAQDESDFDRRVDLERYAGERLEKLVVAK